MSFHSNMFGWDYVWRDFADSKGGEIFTEGNKEDGEIFAITVPAGEATVTFSPTSAGTTVVIDFEPSTDFVFQIYREKPLHQISKVLGMQDIVIGAKDFDSHFIIKSNNEAALKQIFHDATLRDLILQEDAGELQILPPGSNFDSRWVVRPYHAVIAYSRGVTLDKHDQLNNVYELLYRIVLHLEKMGLSQRVAGGNAQPQQQQQEQSTSKKLHSPLLDRK